MSAVQAMPQAKGLLHDVLEDAEHLAALLEAMDLECAHLEVVDGRRALREALDVDRGEPVDPGLPIPWTPLEICKVASEAAWLVAVLLGETTGLRPMPLELQGVVLDLLMQLRRLGLMECFQQEDGGFGIW